MTLFLSSESNYIKLELYLPLKCLEEFTDEDFSLEFTLLEHVNYGFTIFNRQRNI